MNLEYEDEMSTNKPHNERVLANWEESHLGFPRVQNVIQILS